MTPWKPGRQVAQLLPITKLYTREMRRTPPGERKAYHAGMRVHAVAIVDLAIMEMMTND